MILCEQAENNLSFYSASEFFFPEDKGVWVPCVTKTLNCSRLWL